VSAPQRGGDRRARPPRPGNDDRHRVYHGAGATEAQELAAGLATAMQYLRWLEAEGHDLEDAARRIGFVLTADADQFLTIAKLRAARVLWGRAQVPWGSSLNLPSSMSKRPCG
jgi:methylmalonyl-CoA mutase N-terminal domain/subunit